MLTRSVLSQVLMLLRKRLLRLSQLLKPPSLAALVPLLKGRAEEKNGTIWLNSDALEDDRSPAGAKHYIAVKTALKRISGKKWDVAGVKRGSTNFNVLLDKRDGDDKGKRRKKDSTALIEFDDSSVKIAEERDTLKAKCDVLEAQNLKNRFATNPKRSSPLDT